LVVVESSASVKVRDSLAWNMPCKLIMMGERENERDMNPNVQNMQYNNMDKRSGLKVNERLARYS